MKGLIKQKAQELFMQYGMRSVSMDDIASSVGSSKKTLYQYYQDKEELVAEVVNEAIKNNHKCCEEDHIEAKDAIQEVFFAMDATAELFNSINPSVLFDLHKYHPKIYQSFTSYKHNYLYNIIKTNIERGISEGLYRNDIDVETMAQYRVQSAFVPFHPDFYSKVSKSLFEIHKELFIHFLYGIVSLKGYELIDKYREELK